MLSTYAISVLPAADAMPVHVIDWATAIERLVLVGLLILVFVWTAWRREQRMSHRIGDLEGHLESLIEKLAILTETVTVALARNNEILAAATKSLETRTCLAFANRDEFEKWQQSQVDDGK